jgi:uncharacterized membrane protein
VSINKTDDAVAEYLREVEARLGGLPLLQRRELLADLEAHIATERAERNVQSEAEVLEILERLGSPDVVAAAAYEEAEPNRTTAAPYPAGWRPPATGVVPRRAARPRWLIPVIVGVVLFFVVMFLACGLSVVRGDKVSRPVPVAPVPAVPAQPPPPATR